MTKWLILGALLSSAAGCAPMPSTASPAGGLSGELLTFERTGGTFFRGYELVLSDDGRLQFHGWGLVHGPAWDDVPIEPAAMAKVRSSLDRLSTLDPDCCNCSNMTDQPWVIMTFRTPDGTGVKKIEDYKGCDKTPAWVYDAEDSIDQALETERWLGKKVVSKPRQ